MIENPMVSGLAAHQELDEARASEESARYAYLYRQMFDALLNDPNREVDCPAFASPRRPAARAAWIAVEDKHVDELFDILSDASKGIVQPIRTDSLLNSIAHAHADLHAGAEE
jgi:hypothetical protein